MKKFFPDNFALHEKNFGVKKYTDRGVKNCEVIIAAGGGLEKMSMDLIRIIKAPIYKTCRKYSCNLLDVGIISPFWQGGGVYFVCPAHCMHTAEGVFYKSRLASWLNTWSYFRQFISKLWKHRIT